MGHLSLLVGLFLIGIAVGIALVGVLVAAGEEWVVELLSPPARILFGFSVAGVVLVAWIVLAVYG